MKLNDRIRALRIKSGLTQEMIAEKLDVALTTYSNWEQGTRKPNYNIIIALADIHGCSTDYILGRTNNFNEVLKTPTVDECLVIVTEDANVPKEKVKDYIEFLKHQHNKKD